MNEHPITLDQIVAWLRSKERNLGDSGVTLVEVRERRVHVPAAAADFEATHATGRINAWVSGEFDFEVPRKEDGTDLLLRHEDVSSLDEPILERAYADFLRRMLNVDETVPGQP